MFSFFLAASGGTIINYLLLLLLDILLIFIGVKSLAQKKNSYIMISEAAQELNNKKLHEAASRLHSATSKQLIVSVVFLIFFNVFTIMTILMFHWFEMR